MSSIYTCRTFSHLFLSLLIFTLRHTQVRNSSGTVLQQWTIFNSRIARNLKKFRKKTTTQSLVGRHYHNEIPGRAERQSSRMWRTDNVQYGSILWYISSYQEIQQIDDVRDFTQNTFRERPFTLSQCI